MVNQNIAYLSIHFVLGKDNIYNYSLNVFLLVFLLKEKELIKGCYLQLSGTA